MFSLTTRLLLTTMFCLAATAQTYTLNDAIDIFTKNDGLPCQPQRGADENYYRSGCCSSPGNRQCFLACTAPDANDLRWNSYDNKLLCNLPAAIPELPAALILSPAKPANRDYRFFVTSDLHFYRVNFPVATQYGHPGRMNLMHLQSSLQGKPYSAVVIPGDISTGPNEQRLATFRTLYERGWLPGASINLPVFIGFGNHDITSLENYAGAEPDDARRMWDYLDARMRAQNLDTSATGCLVGIDPFCLGFGNQAGSHNYSWDWHGVHHVMLNTWAGETQLSFSPPLGANGLEWLKRDLAHFVGNTGKPVILFQHYTMNTTRPYWTPENKSAFLDVIKRYNVIALFTGHIHGFDVQNFNSTVNQPATGSTDGLANYLDDINDGAGGDCGTANCTDAEGDFLSVQLSNNYLDVTAYSWKLNSTTAPNTGMGFGPNGDQATCRKRITSNYTDITSQFTTSIDNAGRKITITNNSGSAIGGPLAVRVLGAGNANVLTKWDFLNRCGAQASALLVVTETSMAANATITLPFEATNGASRLIIYRLGDALSIDNTNPVVGGDPVDVQISTLSGKATRLTATVDPYTTGDTTQWLAVDLLQNTTPATLRMKSNTGLSRYDHLTATVTITSEDTNIAPVKLTVSLPPASLSVQSNVSNAKLLYDGQPVGIPFNAVVSPNSQHKIDIETPQSPSTGVRYLFNNWSNGGAKLQNLTVPFGGTTLTANFNTLYEVKGTISPLGGGNIQILTPGGPSFFAPGAFSVSATPNAGFYFAGFTGDIESTNPTPTIQLRGPINYNANFAPNPLLTLNSTAAGAPGSQLLVNGAPQPWPFSQSYAPGTQLSLAVPAMIQTAPGARLAFKQWSDGNTNASRTLSTTTSAQSLTAQYEQQFLVDLTVSPANAGTVSGSGWFTSGAGAVLTATPQTGFTFTGFSGSRTSPSSPLAFNVSAAEAITANFASAATPTINASRSAASTDTMIDGISLRSLPLLIRNSGPGGATNVQITGITDITVVGGTGTVTAALPQPISIGTLGPNASTNATVYMAWPSTATRVRLTIQFSANGGAWRGSTTLNLFR